MDRWYWLVTVVVIGACLVLCLGWLQGRQVAVRVDPVIAQIEEFAAVTKQSLNTIAATRDTRLAELERRIAVLEARPVERVVIREVDRPVPVFARGKAIGR